MLKKQNGITLIALIITIIVMLILVGVTVNVALNGGLFQKAEQATKETEEKAILEEMLAMMEITDEGKINSSEIIKKMRVKYPELKYDESTKNATITGKLGTYNYIVSETEIKIGGSDIPPIDQDLKRYILGPAETGRPFTDIAVTTDGETFTFIDDELTPEVDETETLNVQLLCGTNNEDNTKILGYIKCNDQAYKVTLDTAYNTEDLDLIYTPKEFEGEDLGEVTGDSSYNGWTILYNNGNTLEAVSPQTMGTLKIRSTSNSEGLKFSEYIDLYYNNAIKTINDYCKNELTGLPSNSSVRSVGSAIETSNDENNKYKSSNLAAWNSEYNGVGKKGDILYVEDCMRMSYYGVLGSEERYWIASRVVHEFSDNVDFCVRYFDRFA